MTNLAPKCPISGEITQSGFDQEPPKYTLPALYALHFQLNFDKLKASDKDFLLTNMETSLTFVNRFAKQVIADAESQFDKQ